jgi:hypothetical protein
MYSMRPMDGAGVPMARYALFLTSLQRTDQAAIQPLSYDKRQPFEEAA